MEAPIRAVTPFFLSVGTCIVLCISGFAPALISISTALAWPAHEACMSAVTPKTSVTLMAAPLESRSSSNLRVSADSSQHQRSHPLAVLCVDIGAFSQNLDGRRIIIDAHCPQEVCIQLFAPGVCLTSFGLRRLHGELLGWIEQRFLSLAEGRC